MGLTLADQPTQPRRQSAAAKRVLLVNPWSTCHGGTSMVLLEFVKHLDRERFEPTVLCPAEGDLPERLKELEAKYLIHSLSGLTRQSWHRFIADAYWYVRLLRRERFDLVHLNGPKWRSSIAWAAHYCHVPLVVHVHNPVRHAEKNFSLRWAQRILPVSRSVGEAIWNCPRLREKTEPLHNGVELERFTPEGPNNRDELAIAADVPLIGFVGQIVPRKGLIYLIEALPQILQSSPNARLVVVGAAPAGEESYELKCRDLAKQLNVAGSIDFVGFRRDVDRWMRTFDLFVLPTRSEPFGKVVIEAMAARCPVVATRVGGIPEIITQPELGTLVAKENPAALAAAITPLLADPTRRQQIAAAACDYVKKTFSLEAMIGRLQDVYTKAINHR